MCKKLAKADIIEQHSKSMSGTLNLEDMSIECESVGKKYLADLLEKFDGEYVKINIQLKSEIQE